MDSLEKVLWDASKVKRPKTVLILNNTTDKQSLRPSGVKQVCLKCPDVYMKVAGAFQSSQPLAEVSIVTMISRVLFLF